jgi:hypothetical protein
MRGFKHLTAGFRAPSCPQRDDHRGGKLFNEVSGGEGGGLQIRGQCLNTLQCVLYMSQFEMQIYKEEISLKQYQNFQGIRT